MKVQQILDLEQSVMHNKNPVQHEFKYTFMFFALFGCHNFTNINLDHHQLNKTRSLRIILLVIRLTIMLSLLAYWILILRDRKVFTNSLVLAMQFSNDTSFIFFVVLTLTKYHYGMLRLVKFYSQVNAVMEILSNEFTIVTSFSKVKKRTTVRISLFLLAQGATIIIIAVIRKRIGVVILVFSPIIYMLICVIFVIFQCDVINVLLSSLHECLVKFHKSSKNISKYESWLLNISDKGLRQLKRRKLKVLQKVYVTICDNVSIVNNVNGPTILIFILILIIGQILTGYRLFMMLSDKKGLDFAFRMSPI